MTGRASGGQPTMFSDAFLIVAMRIAGALLWLVYMVALARGLDQSDFATALYAMNISFIGILVISMGRDIALLKFASHNWAQGNRSAIRCALGRSRLFVLASGVGFTLALVLASRLGLDTLATQDWRVALLTGLLTLAGAQMGINRESLRAIGKVWQSQLGLNMTRSLVPILGSAIALATTGLSVAGALALFLASLVLSLVIEEGFLRSVDWKQPKGGQSLEETRKAFSQVTKSSLALWPGDIANALHMRAGALMAGLMLSAEATALFLAAERIAGLAQFPIAAAAQAAAPKIAHGDGQFAGRNRGSLQTILSQASLLVSMAALIGVCTTALLAYPILWALGSDFLPALPIVAFMLAGHAAWIVFGLAVSTLNLTGHHGAYSRVAIPTCAVALVVMWLGFTLYGAAGGAAAFALSLWFTHLAYTITLARVTRLQTGAKAIDRQTIAFAKKAVLQRLSQ